MSLRLKHTNRRNLKTKEKLLNNSITYLVWDEHPPELKITFDEVIGKRAWVAGTSESDIWIIKSIHEPGTPEFPEGGLILGSKKENDIAVFLDEVILHPNQKIKK